MIEVTNVSKHGFWIFLGDEELFVSFSQFPWFKDAPVSQLLNIEWPQPHHLNTGRISMLIWSLNPFATLKNFHWYRNRLNKM